MAADGQDETKREGEWGGSGRRVGARRIRLMPLASKAQPCPRPLPPRRSIGHGTGVGECGRAIRYRPGGIDDDGRCRWTADGRRTGGLSAAVRAVYRVGTAGRGG